jgi:23S rRNA (cytidine1920-2'-O)/16S rRNA (cytidine1409-2'-O)-methyltransferase
MEFRLRQDPRLRLLERTNARYLEPADIGELIDFVATDVSFISATLVLPAVIRAVAAYRDPSGTSAVPLVVLVKPQFEAGRELVGKGGIVRDEAAQQAAIVKVETAIVELGGQHTGWIESPILGGEGNREFLLYAEFSPPRGA